MGMSRSEAGKLGSLALVHNNAIRREKSINDYGLNPKLCKECEKPLTYQQAKLKNTFCSSKCSKKYWDSHSKRTGRLKENNHCIVCGNKTSRGSRKYCSLKCQSEKRQIDFYSDVENKGEIPTFKGGCPNSKAIRKYLKHRDGWACSICHNTEWMGKKITLHADHIDGNSNNNKLVNLRWVCPNCDSQLPTYCGKNKGSGRYYRRQRYRDGKSF